MQINMVRHGESHWNVEDRYQGHADSGLTPLGKTQAEQAARALLDQVGTFPVVWSSDLPRARDTAQAYADLTGAKVIEDTRLRELSVGTWAGRLLTEIAEEFPDVVAASRAGQDVRRGDGETFGEQRVRVVECLQEIASGNEESALVFSHGGTVRVAAAHAAGVPSPGHATMAPPSNCSLTILNVSADRNALVRFNVQLPGVAETY